MRTSVALLAGVLLLFGAFAPAAFAVDTVISKDAPDLAGARAKIEARDFKGALAELTAMLQTHQHADLYNLIGYSLRKTGDTRQALTFYRKALDFEPAHRGALEYLGELYVEMGQIEKARQNAALLEKACPDGCEELADLRKAIAAAKPQ